MKELVRTSEKNWLAKAIKLYAGKQPFTFEDDAGLKITRADLKSAMTLLRAAKTKAKVSWQQLTGVLAGLGITGAGVWIIAAAILDPEPTTKLGLLIAGGTILALTGAVGTFASLGVKFIVSAKSPRGDSFEIKPE